MALPFGATREVLEVVLRLVVFCGFPTALNGLPVLEDAMAERGGENGTRKGANPRSSLCNGRLAGSGRNVNETLSIESFWLCLAWPGVCSRSPPRIP